MASTLTSLKTRVNEVLADGTASLIFSDAAVTESIRLAIGEYSLAGEAAVTLSGLDSASETTLPALHDSVIVWGAAAYAALGRSIDRSESYQIGSGSAELKAWGEARLKEFKGMLGVIFPGYLVVLSAGGSGSGSEDPAKLAAEVALLTAQAAKVDAETAAITAGETSGSDPDKVAAEIDLLGAQTDKAAAEVELLGAQADLATSQASAAGDKAAAEADLLGAQADLTAAQSAEKEAQAAAAARRAGADAALVEAQAAKVAADTALATAQKAKVEAETAAIGQPGGMTGEDPDKLAAEIALLAANKALAEAQAAASVGQEARAQAAADEADAAAAAKAVRLDDMRQHGDSPWGTWSEEDDGIGYLEGYDRK